MPLVPAQGVTSLATLQQLCSPTPMSLPLQLELPLLERLVLFGSMESDTLEPLRQLLPRAPALQVGCALPACCATAPLAGWALQLQPHQQ